MKMPTKTTQELLIELARENERLKIELERVQKELEKLKDSKK